MNYIKFDSLSREEKSNINLSLKRGEKINIRFDKSLNKWRWYSSYLIGGKNILMEACGDFYVQEKCD